MALQLAQVYNLKSDDSMITSFAYDCDAAGKRTIALKFRGGNHVMWTARTNRLTRQERSEASAYGATYTCDAPATVL